MKRESLELEMGKKMPKNEVASTFFNRLDEDTLLFRELESYSSQELRQVYVLNSPLKKKTKKDAEYLVKQCRANICKDYDLELIRVTNSIRDSYKISNEIRSRSIIYVKN